MKAIKAVAALVASVGLLWGTAHAAPDSAEAIPEVPGVIILELQPVLPGGAPAGEASAASEQEQMMLGMLLLQLLSAMQAEGENVEVQFVTPQQGTSI